ncbi:MAG: hypothetical protein AAGK14_00555 [Verrucomicrobiota bacterium]
MTARCRSVPFLALGLLLVAAPAGAEETAPDPTANLVANGDFKEGESKWKTSGRIKDVELEESGEKFTVLELSLRDDDTTEIWQEFDVKPSKRLHIEIVAKASEDFKVGGMRGLEPKMKVKGSYLWYPKRRTRNDLLVEINDTGHWHYTAGKLKPGGDWTTLSHNFRNLSLENARGRDFDEREMFIIAPPGEGKIWIKSVRVSLKK